MVYNLGTNMHASDEGYRYLRSCLFETADSSRYIMELVAKQPVGKTSINVRVKPVATSAEQEQGFLARKLAVTPFIKKLKKIEDKPCVETFFYQRLDSQEASLDERTTFEFKIFGVLPD